jgi:hypothetical protein
MIIVIAGKQSACPNEKQKDSRRVSNLVLTAHAGTFIRPRSRAGNACVPHLGATENWTIEQLITAWFRLQRRWLSRRILTTLSAMLQSRIRLFARSRFNDSQTNRNAVDRSSSESSDPAAHALRLRIHSSDSGFEQGD